MLVIAGSGDFGSWHLCFLERFAVSSLVPNRKLFVARFGIRKTNPKVCNDSALSEGCFASAEKINRKRET